MARMERVVAFPNFGGPSAPSLGDLGSTGHGDWFDGPGDCGRHGGTPGEAVGKRVACVPALGGATEAEVAGPAFIFTARP
eukprot:1280608-Pyramimonas_sp.AAC.1